MSDWAPGILLVLGVAGLAWLARTLLGGRWRDDRGDPHEWLGVPDAGGTGSSSDSAADGGSGSDGGG